MKAIIGKKVGMSQIFDENGHVIPLSLDKGYFVCYNRLCSK